MAKRVAFAIPGDLATWTGGYVYDRRIIAELRRLDWDVDVVRLGDGFPTPSGEQMATREARLLAIPRIGRLSSTDWPWRLAQGRPHVASARPVVALVHHPLASETGLARGKAQQLERASEPLSPRRISS